MKRFLLQAALFIICIYILQSLVVVFSPPNIPNNVSRFIHYLDTTDIIFFGDSSLTVFNKKDKNKSGIHEFLRSDLQNVTIEPINQLAYHAGVYAAYVQWLAQSKNTVKTVIVPINLRSFSPEWDMRSQSQFEEETFYLRFEKTPLYPFIQFLTNLRLFTLDSVSVVHYENAPVFRGDKQVGLAKDFDNPDFHYFSEEKLKKKIIFHYMYLLSANHRKLKDFERIKKSLQGSKTKVIFYITPIDYQTGEKYFGNEFRGILRHNVEVVKSRLSDKDTSVLDLSFDLPANDFTWRDELYINEHMKEKGRAYVALRLSEVIKPLLRK